MFINILRSEKYFFSKPYLQALKRKIRHSIPETRKFWFTLDNAAKIYPAIISNKFPAVFRLSVVLKNVVRVSALRMATLQAEKRYPYFRVQMKEGFFWYYLEHLPLHIPVEPDDGPCCRKFSRGSLLIRVLARDNMISAEYSHVLTDGNGALEFLKTLLIYYLIQTGVQIPAVYWFKDPSGNISSEEYEDAYKRFFKEDIPPMVKRPKAFHLPFALHKPYRCNRQQMIVPLKQMKRAADSKGVSITVFLAAVYLHLLQEIIEEGNNSRSRDRRKWLRIQIPVNLRKIFPSRTMRNFSLFVMPEIDLRLGHYQFDEIIKSVYHQLQLETDEKLINKNISRNVGSEKKILVRGMPLFIKSFILRLTYHSLGTSQYSGVVTNLGKVSLPEEMKDFPDYFAFIPPAPNNVLKMNCGVVGYGNKLVISFGDVTNSNEFEQKFIRFLKDQNIQVTVLTNTHKQ